MSQYVFTVNLRDDAEAIDAYRRYHRDVWPEVLHSLRRFGVQRMDIHLLGRRAVMVVEMAEGHDYQLAFKLHAASSQRVAEWERLMKSLQEPLLEAQDGEWWALMEPVFHMDLQEPAGASLVESARVS